MLARIYLALLLAVTTALALNQEADSQANAGANPRGASPTGRASESDHRPGPHDMEGWTLNYQLEGGPTGSYAFTLVLARNGKIVRTIKGDPLIFDWIFWDDGRKVAYETGPLHFGLQCNLVDVSSGKLLKSIDCYQGVPNPPDWLDALENKRQ